MGHVITHTINHFNHKKNNKETLWLILKWEMVTYHTPGISSFHDLPVIWSRENGHALPVMTDLVAFIFDLVAAYYVIQVISL